MKPDPTATPESDSNGVLAVHEGKHSYFVPLAKCRDLERKLTVAREFIERLVTIGHYPEANGTQIVIDAYAILTATAPKP